MSVSKDTIQKVKDATDIVDVVEGFVSLKKRGQYWWGLCPFHDDKSPSMAVTPSKGIYKCFSCGATGDAIKFVEEIEGINYIEAIKWLGQKYGIKVEEKQITDEEKAKQQEKESILVALSYAKDFYINNMLHTAEGKSVGLSYFKERGYNNLTIEKFGLGYSLNDWNALETTALKKDFKLSILEEAGLVTVKGDRKYDRFRNRVMFPIHDLAGRVIAFGARTLKKEDKPKYLNSPETKVYHKSDVLYGIFQGKGAIRTEDNCYLVEGYTDVLSLYQAGIENVVASSGTALTEGQIKLIKRFTNNITVLYDGDEAGIKASLRGTDLILEQGLDVRVVLFPDGHDPDSYCREVGGQRFKEFLDQNAKDFILFKTELLLKGAKNDPIKKAHVTKDIVQSIAKIPDLIKQSVFYKECSRLLDVEEGILLKEGEAIKQREIERREKKIHRAPRDWESVPPPPEYFTGEEKDIEDITLPDTVPALQSQAPKKELTKYFALHKQEEEFIRVLLLYGQQEMDDTGNKLYHFLFRELGSMALKHPVLQEMVIVYKNQAAMGVNPDVEFFLHSGHEDMVSIAKMVQEIEGQVSEVWDAKHNIYIPEKDEEIGKVVYSNMLRLKFRTLQSLCEECMTNIQKATEKGMQERVEEEFKLLMELTAEKNVLAKELGIVIS